MKYIICAGTSEFNPPRQLMEVKGEVIIERTIRLLKENGIEDIQVSSSNPLFDKYGRLDYDSSGLWVNAFAPMDEPVCYVMGDVYFSPEAIKKIVETETDSIEFFASAPPFADNYPKRWAEPYAFKVVDQELLRRSIAKTKELYQQGKFNRHPIAWELWQVIKGTVLNTIDYTNYTVINDYSCDIDRPEDVNQWNF